MKNATALLIALLILASLTACGGTANLIQCKADAVRALPERVDQVTSGDLVKLYESLQACHEAPPAPAPADAGTP